MCVLHLWSSLHQQDSTPKHLTPQHLVHKEQKASPHFHLWTFCHCNFSCVFTIGAFLKNRRGFMVLAFSPNRKKKKKVEIYPENSPAREVRLFGLTLMSRRSFVVVGGYIFISVLKNSSLLYHPSASFYPFAFHSLCYN